MGLLEVLLVILLHQASGGSAECLAQSPLACMTHSMKNKIVLVVDKSDGVMKNARNLFMQSGNNSNLLFWNKGTRSFQIIAGQLQIVDRNTLVYIVGHGEKLLSGVHLGGFTPNALAQVVGSLSFKEMSIGHISLVACHIHTPDDGTQGFLYVFLNALRSDHHIERCSASAWTMEVAVNSEGMLVSRMNGSSLWYANYPGSVVIASIVKLLHDPDS